MRLRRWQKEALDRLDEHPGPDFLAVATPGAGKTTFALTAALRHLAQHPAHRLVVVAPTSHLKLQWAHAAARFGLHLEPQWMSATARLPADMHGIVVTYQQVATNPSALRRHAERCMVVLDELHHAGDERAWGDAVRHAFDPAPRRLAISGTPFRSDTHSIPFVDYHLDEARPNYEYGYDRALADRRVVRPVWFPRINGFMEWTAPDGTTNAASFEDELDRQRSAQRLRTALSLDGEWLPTVLDQAHQRLTELRRTHPSAAGLVIAADQEHARGIARILHQRHRVSAVVATSDDPSASTRIARFAEGSLPWIVAVRMVSEGVDIPRLRLGVFATTTTTELFFRQAVGRFVRHTGGRAADERAWLFIPDDPRLRAWAAGIAEQRRHSLARNQTDDADEPTLEEEAAFDDVPAEVDEQLSLFEVLSAQVLTSETHGPSVFDEDDDLADEDDEDSSVDVELPPPPPPGGGRFSAPLPEDLAGRPLTEVKRELREANADLAQHLVRFTGMSHREVNGRLNRLAGVQKVTEATLDELRRRADQAERWIASL
ncbi:MAG TPA: DEAD/DEAH box helicase family protein [Acidimicrobiales bacterium]|nr:DEAD/DEAH box helicase family protein [Acidimicrobiales bacterium]